MSSDSPVLPQAEASPAAAPGSPLAARQTTGSMQMMVREQLRSEILNGALAGGTRLQQAELAKTYHVSITPVREALRDLAADALVDINPFSGASVHTPTLRELEEIYEVRTELTPLTVQTAIRNITPTELDQAEELVKLMAQTSESDRWAENNRAFHHILDGAARNGQLVRIMRQLADLSTMYVALSLKDSGRNRRANDEHEQLVAAYRAHDPDVAVQLTLTHIAETQELVRREFRRKSLQDLRRK